MILKEIIALKIKKQLYLIKDDESRDTRRSGKCDHERSWIGPDAYTLKSLFLEKIESFF